MKPLNLTKNKKGNFMVIVIFFVLMFLTLFIGFLMVVGSSVTNYIFDIAVPELSTLGQVGDTNMTNVASFTIAPLNTLIQNFTWMTGVLYVIMLVMSVAFVVVVRASPSRWLIGFYFMCCIMLIIGCIFMSNIYEDFFNDNDDFALILQEHTILSWMILYSPTIFTVIAFLTGIILFSNMEQEGSV